MKKSKRLYIIGVLQFLSMFIMLPLIIIVYFFTGPLMKSDMGTFFVSIYLVVSIILFIRGFFTISKAKEASYIEMRDPWKQYMLSEEKRSAKKFRTLISKLCSLGIFREVYRNDLFSVLKFDELFYLLCPYYSIINNEPYGIIIDVDNLYNLIKNKDMIYEYIDCIDDVTFSNITVSLKEKQFVMLLRYSKEHKNEQPSKRVSAEFERKISNNKKYRILTLMCTYMPVISFATLFTSVALGVFMSVLGLAIGIFLISRSRKEYIQINTGIICGIIFSAIIIYMTIMDWTKIADKRNAASYTSYNYMYKQINYTSYPWNIVDLQEYLKLT